MVYPLLPAECSANKSTSYSDAAEAAERISRVLSRVKLIFLLRYPVERAFSQIICGRGKTGWSVRLSSERLAERYNAPSTIRGAPCLQF